MSVFSFGNSILLRRVHTWTYVNYATGREIQIKFQIEVVSTIVCLKDLDLTIELSGVKLLSLREFE